MPTSSHPTIRPFVLSLFARRKLMWRVFLVMSAITLCVTLFLPTKFTVSGQVIVLSSEIPLKESDMLNEGSGTRYLPVSLKDIETEATILRSPTLLKTTVQGLLNEGKITLEQSLLDTWIKQPLKKYIIRPIASLIQPEATPEDTVSPLLVELVDSMEILPLPGSNVIAVNLTTDDIEFGRLIVNRLIDEYLTERSRLMVSSGEHTFDQKKDMYKDMLHSLTDEKMKLFSEHDSQKPGEELSLVLQNINSETKSLNDVSDKLLEIAKWQGYLEKNISLMESSKGNEITIPYGFDSTNSNDTELVAYKEVFQQLDVLRKLQEEYDTAIVSFAQGSLPVSQISEQLELAKKRLISLFKKKNQDQIQKILVLKSMAVEKEKRLTDLRKRASLLSEVVENLSEIETKLNVAKEAFLKYSQVYEEKHMERLFNQSNHRNVKVLDYAPVPLEPAPPKKPLLLILGLFSSLITAITAAVLAEAFNKFFYDPRDIEQTLGIPVVAIIDDLDARANQVEFSLHPKRFLQWINQ